MRVRALLLGASLFALATATAAQAEVHPFEVSEYRKDFGVSGAVAQEALQVQAEGTDIDIVGQLEDRLGEDYAGIWFDNETAEFVVPRLPGASVGAVNSELFQAGLPGSDFRTSPAQSSWAELEAAQDKLDQALIPQMKEGYVQTSIDPRTNAVVIHLAQGIAEAAEQDLRSEAAAQGVEVDIREKGVEEFSVEPVACGQLEIEAGGEEYQEPDAPCDAPLRDGVGIGADLPGEPYNALCTAGFKATGVGTGNRYVLTAGHCVNITRHYSVDYWRTIDSAKKAHYIGYVEQAV